MLSFYSRYMALQSGLRKRRIDAALLDLQQSLMRVAYISVIIALAGCASVQTQLPNISLPSLSNERLAQEGLAFQNIETLTERLMRVSAPIMKANMELCRKTRFDIGATTHNLRSYSKRMRPAAAREFGATEEMTIYNVRSGSPADKAGLRRGDILLSPTQKPMSVYSKRFQTVLEESANALRVKRGDDVFTVSVEPEKICNYPVKLSQTSTINAYANGKTITMTAGMMNFVKDDNELALIIGHELGHNTMGHIRKIVTNMILSLGGTRYTRPFESEADYVGMYYMVRAGYNPSNVEDVWRRLAVSNPKSVARAKTHPTYPNRYLRIAAAREEMRTKKAAGQPLLPNFKTD